MFHNYEAISTARCGVYWSSGLFWCNILGPSQAARLYGASTGKPFYLIYWIWTILLRAQILLVYFQLTTPPPLLINQKGFSIVGYHPFHIIWAILSRGAAQVGTIHISAGLKSSRGGYCAPKPQNIHYSKLETENGHNHTAMYFSLNSLTTQCVI